MYNLKRLNGTFKGNIGECMFKLTRHNFFLTRFHSKNETLNKVSEYLTSEQKRFLRSNWYSIDGFEVINRCVVLYEVKTRNRHKTARLYKPKTTLAEVMMYRIARNIGFKVRIVNVWFEDNWDFSVQINEYNENEFYVDKPKPYDRDIGAIFGENSPTRISRSCEVTRDQGIFDSADVRILSGLFY